MTIAINCFSRTGRWSPTCCGVLFPTIGAQAVDLATLERVHSSHISTDLRERDDDMLWRVRWQHTWLYVYLLLEFQSTVDTYMAVRIQTYVGLLYEGLIRSGQLTPAGQLPPVVPIVLYNGRGRWTCGSGC